jgi:NAD(P)-dependent dehydrogenase (short-subunit alcohol dehydrogenase family)
MLTPKRDRGADANAKEKGVIINWSSVMAHITGSGEIAAYIIAKHAISGLTKSMASAYGIKGIRTNAVAPGYSNPMTKRRQLLTSFVTG